MHVGPSEQQILHDQLIQSPRPSAEEFRNQLNSLPQAELIDICVKQHTEVGLLKSTLQNLRSQLASVALKAEQEDERTVLRLTRELEKLKTQNTH